MGLTTRDTQQWCRLNDTIDPLAPCRGKAGWMPVISQQIIHRLNSSAGHLAAACLDNQQGRRNAEASHREQRYAKIMPRLCENIAGNSGGTGRKTENSVIFSPLRHRDYNTLVAVSIPQAAYDHHIRGERPMSKKVKLFIPITSTVAAVLFGLFAYIPQKVLQSLHQDCRLLRVLSLCSFEAKEEYYPVSSALLLRASMYSSVKDQEAISPLRNAKSALSHRNSRTTSLTSLHAVRLDRRLRLLEG